MTDPTPTPKPAPKPEPRVWVAYRLAGDGPFGLALTECYVRTARVEALQLAADHGLKYAHVPRSADLVEAVRDL